MATRILFLTSLRSPRVEGMRAVVRSTGEFSGGGISGLLGPFLAPLTIVSVPRHE